MKGPKTEMTPELRTWVKDRKEDILSYLAMTDASPTDAPIPVSKAMENPLSYGQARLWFLDGVTAGGSSYNIALALDMHGELDPAILTQALQILTTRHDILRTVFLDRDGVPKQRVDPHMEIALKQVDLSDMREKRRRFETLQILEAHADKRFDLAAGPLVEFSLIRQAAEEHLLVAVMHHIVSDDWSLGIMIRELSETYAALAEGKQTTLKPLPIQFPDYAAWDQSPAVRESRQRGLAYWTNLLDGANDYPALPTDRPALDSNSSEGASLAFKVPLEVSTRLSDLGQQRGVTLFTTLITAFGVFLSRYCREEELVIGAPVANRTREEVEDLIGFFVNTLALRVDMGRLGRPGFSEILEQMRRTALEAFAHQDVPFDQVVEALGLERAANRNPLFRVFFILQNAHMETLTLPKLQISPRPMPVRSAKFDLTLVMSEGPDGLEGAFEYRTALFDASSIQRAADHFLNLLKGIAADIERPIGDYELMDQDERTRLLVSWNASEPKPVTTTRLHDCVLSGLRAAPEACAIWEPVSDRRMSGLELETATANLAWHFKQIGAVPGDVIAVCMPRCPEMAATLLAVLRAGCTYLPLDPAYPQERLAYMLNDASARFTAHAGQPPELPAEAGQVSVNVLEVISNPTPRVWHDPDVPAEMPAYLIYTSGSTGAPKGVMISHGAAAGFVNWALEQFSQRELSSVLAATSICFDLSIFELFTTLSSGGTVVLVENALVLAALPEAPKVTLINTVPSAMVELLQADCLPLSLRTVNLAGEPIPIDLIRRLLKLRHVRSINNLYGPSEDTTYSTQGTVKKSHQGTLIGRPIPGTQAYVLDRAGEPVPTGIPGELVLAGAGLAQGYFNRPGLTAARFTPNPFSDTPGMRMYHTGDRVRYRVKGKRVDLQFLGRVDRQVKVRGFRIEPGELEHRLSAMPMLEAACVDVRSSSNGAPLIVAYLVPKLPQPNLVGLVREHLKKHLPTHMMPNTFLVLDLLPTTPNGKINRAALPDPGENTADTVYTPPRTPTEEMLVEIWSEVLDVTPIGIHDNFFQLGGHSLLGPLVLSLVKKSFGISLPFKSLFEAPTVAGMATLVSAGKKGVQVYPEIEPNPAHRFDPFPLTDVQFAYWIGRSNDLELGQVATHVYQEVSMVELDVGRFQAGWQTVINRHEMLRAVFDGDGTQRILPEYEYQIAVTDLRGASAERVSTHIETARAEMSHQVLPCDQPLYDIRISLLDQHVRVHTSFDALILDASSMRIVVSDFATLYEKPDAVLPDVPFSFRDYVMAETAFRETQTYQASLDYWRQRFATLPPGPDLPLAIHPSELDKPQFVSRKGGLNQAQWRALKSKATQRGLTPAGALLAAFAEVLALWSKTPHFCINLTLFNRLPFHPRVNDTVGDFTSLTMLEVDGSKGACLSERGKRLQERLWEDMDHRHVSGVRVLRELRQVTGSEPETMMPVVFTSTVGIGDESFFEANVEYGISQTPQVWLDHQVNEREGELIFNWDSVEALFPPGLLDDMFSAWSRLLVDMAETDEVWEQHLTIPAHHSQLLQQVNRTDVVVPELLLHENWRRAAQANPDAPAVMTADESWSHGRLADSVSVWSAVLAIHGVAANQLVAVILDKGPLQIAAVLAILESGAAYLPIAADLPAARRDYLLNFGQVNLVLTTAKIKSGGVWPGRVTVLAMDAKAPAVGTVPPAVRVSPQQIAYVIFTSGSTGQPKGVTVNHRAAMNTIWDINQRFDVGPSDRVLGLSALNFDLSVYDVFGVLGVGGGVVLPNPADLKDPAAWLELMDRHRVSLWNTVPALMQMLVDYIPIQGGVNLEHLRLVMLSGDWIPLSLPDRIRASAPEAKLVSLGGATEAAIWSIMEPIQTVEPHWKSIPYGKPMANQRFHVLDNNLNPRPIWAVGHLHIAGEGLADAYWRDPVRTAQSFIVNPATGERLYCTGDLGRYLPDGRIEFLGRDDNQVKIRGYRIELGEIEATLAKHPGLSEAAVIVSSQSGSQDLIAFVVEREQEQIPAPTQTPAELTDHEEKAAFVLSRPGLRELAEAGLKLPADDVSLQCGRRSVRRFQSQPINTADLTSWLACLTGVQVEEQPLPKFAYPSPGSLYAAQVYLQVKPDAVEGLAAGSYYLNPDTAQLHRLSDGYGDREMHAPVNQFIFDQAAFSIFIIAQMKAVQPVYGEHARELCLVESGYMGQLLMAQAPQHNLGLCPIGGVVWSGLEEDLALDSGHEFLHAFLGGISAEPATLKPMNAPAPGQAAQAASDDDQANVRVTRGELAEYLGRRLPDYMIPSQFVFLDQMPRTTNGKTDRGALKPPEPKQETALVDTAPSGALEQDLATLWCDVLGRESVSIHDNFFTMGGDSLSAVKLVAQIAEKTGIKIGMRFLFSNPTIAAVAALLDDSARKGDLKRPSGNEPAAGVGEQFLKVEQRPLLTLFGLGRLAPVDAASLMYVPLELLEMEGIDPDWVIDEWMHGLPLITDVLETEFGRTAVIMLPILSVDLYGKAERLHTMVIEGMRMSRFLGAKTVSLMGLIPSATQFGKSIVAALPKDEGLPRLSTGHATTGAAVLLSIHQILETAGRDAAKECIGFLGLGSIGALGLRSILTTLPHPKEIILCELETRAKDVAALADEIREHFSYRGGVTISLSKGEPDQAIYDADLIVGAVGAGGILDVNRLKPGAMIVDDSFPKFFDVKMAARRVRTQRDILFTDGGYLETPGGIERVSHQAGQKGMSDLLTSQEMITSCVFSAILSSRFPQNLPPLLGEIDLAACLHHFNTLRELGVRAADLTGAESGIDEDYIAHFRQCYGKRAED